MLDWVYTLIFLLLQQYTTSRDAKIRFLREENRILRSRVKSSRIILSPSERFRLLQIGVEFGHRTKGVISIVTFKTYQRWLREQREGKVPSKVGRPRKIGEAVYWAIIRFARQNRQWGYRRIVGELLKLYQSVSKTTVARILKEQGVYPHPGKGKNKSTGATSAWDKFILLHMNTLVACDFFCKAVWTPFGKRQAYCLFFIHLGSRKVFVSPATYHPNEQWVKQQARNVMMWLEDMGIDATHLIRDRDAKFTKRFDLLLKSSGIKVIKLPARSPNLNAYAEAWVGTIKRECLNYFFCFSLKHMDHLVQSYARFYNELRPHQSKGNRVLKFKKEKLRFPEPTDRPLGKIRCKRFLGGVLKHYYPQAA